jgi:hypothetical protein
LHFPNSMQLRVLLRKRFVRAGLSTLLCGSIAAFFFCNFVVRDSDRSPDFGPDLKASSPTCSKQCEDRGYTKVVVDALKAGVGSETPLKAKTVLDPLNPLASLKGPPTQSYKGEAYSLAYCPLYLTLLDNLRPQTKYITSWGSSAGWSKPSALGSLLQLDLSLAQRTM